MPKITKIEATIPTLYRRSALNLLMYGFVKGTRAALPTITIKQGISMFMEAYNLNHDDFNSDTAFMTYHRMQKELFNINKNK